MEKSGFFKQGPFEKYFIDFIEKKEKILFEIANEFRKIKVW